MKLTLLLFLIGSVAALAATEEKLHRQFPVQPGGTIVVEADFGTINVSTNANGELVVDVWRKIGRKKKADEEAFLLDNPVTITQDGNTVTVRSPGKIAWSWSGGGRNQNEAKYTITVPARFGARLRTGGGGIEVTDLTGEVRAHTGGGGVGFTRLHGSLEGDSGGGGIAARNCDGTLNCRTGGGGIEVKEFQGAVHATSGGGGLTIERVDGAVEASTGGGSISAVLPSEVSDTVKLTTGGGGIKVSVPATASFDLDAKTAGGSISTDLPVAVVGKTGGGRLQGPVNGGGKTVELRSGGGGIHLKKL
jgi:hypothetical protein